MRRSTVVHSRIPHETADRLKDVAGQMGRTVNRLLADLVQALVGEPSKTLVDPAFAHDYVVLVLKEHRVDEAVRAAVRSSRRRAGR